MRAAVMFVMIFVCMTCTDAEKKCSEGHTKTCGKGACSGVQVCEGGEWTECSSLGNSCGKCDCQCVAVETVNGIEIQEKQNPQPEILDGIDNDCDGLIDEDWPCSPGSMQFCGTDIGECEFGFQVCENGFWSEECVGEVGPVAEACNGLDDDCDGMIDEDFECQMNDPQSYWCVTSCGTFGTKTCNESCRWNACVPFSESCNGIDDDCDGVCDNGFDCCQNSSTQSCITSCGTTGTKTCNLVCMWGPCQPPTEVCNGWDDDCDGLVDEGFPCQSGSTQSCTTSCGSTGTKTCNSSCLWGSCIPPAESCNNRDDDCDGLIDEDFSCRIGSTRSCTTFCGTSGTQTCNSSCTWGSCQPPLEICNGRDDDCDGLVDEGFTCQSGSTQSCTTSCGSTGTKTCNSSCLWGSCIPPAESCNNRDDDCDGQIDEGCCFDFDEDGYQGQTDSCRTGQDCNDADPSVHPGATEICNGVDDNCNGRIDEWLGATSCGVGACWRVVENCIDGVPQTCIPGTPTSEICNYIDDDCDGLVDEDIPLIINDDFTSFDSTRWELNGSAEHVCDSYCGCRCGGRIQLTQANPWLAGSLFLNRRIRGTCYYGSRLLNYEVSFRFRIGGGTGADGLAFVMAQNTSAPLLGGNGGSLGYSGPPGNLAGIVVEFDTYYSPGIDNSENHVALGWTSLVAMVENSSIPELEDTGWHLARIQFFSLSCSNFRVVVYLDGAQVIDHTFTGGFANSYFFGFTAATGGLTNLHEIDDVTMRFEDRGCY